LYFPNLNSYCCTRQHSHIPMTTREAWIYRKLPCMPLVLNPLGFPSHLKLSSAFVSHLLLYLCLL
jgi:hypothetical protein